MSRRDPRRWLQYWPALLLPVFGAAIVSLPLCPGRRLFCNQPWEIVAGGALVGLLLAIVSVWATEAQLGKWAPSIEEVLIISARADDITANGARLLGLRIRSGDAFVVTVNGRGIRVLSAAPASDVLLDASWAQLGPPQFENSRRKGYTPIDSVKQPDDYARLSLDVRHGSGSSQLQFPVVTPSSGQFSDTSELLEILRTISEYQTGARP